MTIEKEQLYYDNIMNYRDKMKSGDSFAGKVVLFLGVVMDIEQLIDEAFEHGVDPNTRLSNRIRSAVRDCGYRL
tara:strand:+ start:302 stop:523 length:222 start_codon:yes stop_codon:yes gene_type:complete